MRKDCQHLMRIDEEVGVVFACQNLSEHQLVRQSYRIAVFWLNGGTARRTVIYVS